MMNQSAQGLASLGRGNDSMLVHMTPREVQGLQGLAMAHGGSLTINPQTGLPEAGFLDSILPTVAGLGLNAMFPGLGALGTGLLVGGVTALASGDLGKGVLAGFGAGSGAGLGKTFAEMGKGAVGGISGNQAIGAVGQDIVQQLPSNVAQNAAQNLGMFNSVGATPAMGAVGNAVPGAALSNFNNLGLSSQSIGPGVNSAVNAMGAAPSAAQLPQSSLLGDAGSRLGEMGEGFKTFASDPFGAGYDAFKTAGGNTMDLLSPVAAVGMEALKPEPYAGYQDPDKGKYRGPQGQLNLSDQFDTGLRLVAKGGYINGYALGGAVNTNPSVGGGLSDLYNRPEGATTQNISTDGYGIGRLNNLANEQSRYQAQTLGYADGGNVNTNETDKPNPEGVVSLYKTVVDDKGVSSRERVPYQYSKIITPGVADFYDISPIEYAANVYPGAILPKFKKEQMAKGGYLDGQGDGMSDSIPATIEGKQPARLADGEFVIPADVVSHLGNGSSKAGSKRLYAMLDKVRHARTGNKKQGKEIKPEKYMPA
jgi:hypothetical protein